MAIDDTLVQHPADLADPVVDVDFGAAQAQRRFTAHGDAMGALSTVQTAVFAIAYFLRIPTPEHLVHEAIIVGCIVARIDVLRRFLKKNVLIQDVGAGLITMSYLGNAGWRSKRASTACIAALPSVMPFW